MIKTTSVDIPSIQETIYENMKPSGWANLLRSFMLSGDFTLILQQLYELTVDKKRFTPTIKEMFRAFIECPYKDLHTVFVNREPFMAINTANGIAFDSSVSGREHPYTGLIFDAIQRTVYPGEVYNRDLNLSRWANQGILLYNATLTVQIDKPYTHNKIWEPFTAFLLDTLSIHNAGLHFVFVGADVKHLGNMINSRAHYKYAIPHPSTAAQSKGIWDSQNIFPILLKQVKRNFKQDIIW